MMRLFGRKRYVDKSYYPDKNYPTECAPFHLLSREEFREVAIRTFGAERVQEMERRGEDAYDLARRAAEDPKRAGRCGLCGQPLRTD